MSDRRRFAYTALVTLVWAWAAVPIFDDGAVLTSVFTYLTILFVQELTWLTLR